MDEPTAQYYESHARTAAAKWESAAGPERWFELAFPERARVLDVGSGSGRDLARLIARGYDAQGVEPSAALRQLSVQLHPELASRVSAGELPASIPDFGPPFDGILCSAVWQHLAQSQVPDAINSIRNLLRPQGRVLLTVSGLRPGLDATFRDEFGRLCAAVDADELTRRFELAGFLPLGRWTEPDYQGRRFEWTVLLFELRPAAANAHSM